MKRRIIFTTLDGHGDEVTLSLPAHNVVCPVCAGEGSRVNPAIDGNGLTAEDFAEDPDFEEGYRRGDYDIQCDRCNGAGLVLDVDRNSAALQCPEALRAYDDDQIERLRGEAEAAAERRQELGYYA